MAVEREERGSIELSDPFESFLRENGNECRSPPRKRRKRVCFNVTIITSMCMKRHSSAITDAIWVVDFQVATDKPVNIPEPFKADYIPENFPEPFDSEDHSAHGDHTGCTRTSSVGPTPPTTAPETLTQCHTLDDLSIPSILIDDDIDITSIQTDSETFVLSPDLSADLDASPNLKLYIGANISTLQAISMLVSWFSTFPGLSKSSFTHLLGILHNFILPKENNLPTTYDEAVAKLKPFLTPVKDYHCCINDCIFRDCRAGNCGKLERCPHSNEERYLSGSKIPRKQFKYLSLEKTVSPLFCKSKNS